MWQCTATHAVQAELHSGGPIFTLRDPGYRVAKDRGRVKAQWLASGESSAPSGDGERDSGRGTKPSVAMQRTAIGTFHCQIRCLSYVNLDGEVAVRTPGNEITGQ